MPHKMHCVYWQREMVIDYCSTYYTILQSNSWYMDLRKTTLGSTSPWSPTLLISEMETSANNSQAASLNILRMLFAFHLCLVIWKNSSLARKRQVSLRDVFHLDHFFTTVLFQNDLQQGLALWSRVEQPNSLVCLGALLCQLDGTISLHHSLVVQKTNSLPVIRLMVESTFYLVEILGFRLNKNFKTILTSCA